MIRKLLPTSTRRVRTLFYPQIFLNNRIVFETKMATVRTRFNALFQAQFKPKNTSAVLGIYDLSSLLAKFRNLIPLLTSFFLKRNSKILVIGNQPQITSLMHTQLFRRFRRRFFFFKQEWADGFLTNQGQFELVRIYRTQATGFLGSKYRIILRKGTPHFSAVIVLKEIDNRELEIVRSMYQRRVPVISLLGAGAHVLNHKYSSYNLYVNTAEIHSFFFFLWFLRKKFTETVKVRRTIRRRKSSKRRFRLASFFTNRAKKRWANRLTRKKVISRVHVKTIPKIQAKISTKMLTAAKAVMRAKVEAAARAKERVKKEKASARHGNPTHRPAKIFPRPKRTNHNHAARP